jgi:hypothetical protein
MIKTNNLVIPKLNPTFNVNVADNVSEKQFLLNNDRLIIILIETVSGNISKQNNLIPWIKSTQYKKNEAFNVRFACG